MNIFILSCGVFEPELNKILKEIKEEKIFEQDIEVKYLPFGLHTNLNKLKYEITANLEDFIKTARDMLKDKGEFFMVHRPERLVDILYFMRKYKIEPKEIRFIYSHINDAPKMILIKGVKNGKAFLKFRENLYIYDETGNYTEEIYKIYGK